MHTTKISKFGFSYKKVAIGVLILALNVCNLALFSHTAKTQKSDFIESILEESPNLVKICEIQGSSYTSPYVGQTVRTMGVVHADFDEKSVKGFFLQEENCDGDPNTSDGIYVYIGEKQNVVASGDWVEVMGTVQEYYGKTEISTTPMSITVIAQGELLPFAVDLSPPFDNNAAFGYFESLEGMYVRLEDAYVVGPTSSRGESWVIRSDLGISRVFQDDPLGTGEIVCVDERGLYEVNPQVKVGDRILGLIGALDYSVGLYRMQLVAEPSVIQTSTAVPQSPEFYTSQPITFTVATFNLANLFDNKDDISTEDSVLSYAEYQRRLKKRALAIHHVLGEPDLIAVQETENLTVTQELANRSEIMAEYYVEWVDTPDKRGLDVALLYRSDRFIVRDVQQKQGCTTLVDGFGPDGNGDQYDPQNVITCDSDDDGVLDGNRLFSRPPLLIQMEICQAGCLENDLATDEGVELWLIINHWKSKVEDTRTTQYTLPRRVEQAQYVADLVDELKSENPAGNILVLGDLNDYPDSQPIAILKNSGLVDLSILVNKPQRYSYNYRGVSQVLDYILINKTASLLPHRVEFFPINADYPVEFERIADTFHRSSDHDLMLVEFGRSSLFYFPIILSSGGLD